jgi:hypothetical protein
MIETRYVEEKSVYKQNTGQEETWWAAARNYQDDIQRWSSGAITLCPGDVKLRRVFMNSTLYKHMIHQTRMDIDLDGRIKFRLFHDLHLQMVTTARSW